ncbi:hypothetical protein [Paenibacillus pini]|uniref:Uncharacterized protein n=1 Tax=Paenibacillus pini JCM 16418 TaxID=1236976 RepID=W7YQK8_9BACL|nr:hypothetical protein [Paenibacillus pini]GAF10842.1 hypothetical protein JCM16418_5067 [Paenibacillus pini JCM 16418]
MSVVDSTIIEVLNYSDSYASIQTQIKPDGYLFEPSIDGLPYAIPLSFAEIRVVNSQSGVFREGILRFDPEHEEDVYTKLGIRDWEEILSDSQIHNIILKPTKKGLESLIKITSTSMFERVRGIMVQLLNTGMYDISTRVKDVINERYRELYSNKRISEIIVVPTLDESEAKPLVSENEMAKLKDELTKQILAELKEQQQIAVDNEVITTEGSKTSVKKTSRTTNQTK